PELRLEVNLRLPPGEALEAELEQAAAQADRALDRGLAVALRAGAVSLAAATGPEQRVRVLTALAEAESALSSESASKAASPSTSTSTSASGEAGRPRAEGARSP